MTPSASPAKAGIFWKLDTYFGSVERKRGQSEKKQGWKCKGHEGLEMLTGENATCNGCLAHRETWAGNNSERVKELWQTYRADHREEISENMEVIGSV